MSKQKTRFRFSCAVIFLLFTGLVLSGCAASSGRIDRNINTVRVGNAKYVPISEICRQYQLSWEWDGFSRIISLKSNTQHLKLFIGSSLILRDEQVVDLRSPVRFHKGMVLIPRTITGLFLPQAKVPRVAPSVAKKTFLIKRVVIDAGHGGKDPGAVSRSGIREKDIVLDVAIRLSAELKKQGLEVLLTRDDDTFYSLQERADIANRAKADLFISIHANAAKSSVASGFEAYYLSADHDDFSKAVQMRENAVVQFETDKNQNYPSGLNALLWDMILTENRMESMALAEYISEELKRDLKLNTRYVRGAMFYVLKGVNMPAVLLEIGYLTNSRECEQLNNAYYRQMLAETIGLGIMRYKKQFENNDGFSR